MYTIIKGDDKCGTTKVLQSGNLSQANDSGLVYCDQREVLLDFTLRDTSTNGKSESSNKLKFQPHYKNNLLKSPKTKEPKFNFNSENSVINSSDAYYKERFENVYSQKDQELVKDLSNQFSVFNRTLDREDLRMDSSLELNNSDRASFLDDNQVKEMFSTLMLRKDAETERFLMKQFENSSLFISNSGVVLQGNKPGFNFPLSYFEKSIINSNTASGESSFSTGSRPLVQGHAVRMSSSPSSLNSEQGENLVKRQSPIVSHKQDDRNEIKNLMSTEMLQDQIRLLNKPSSLLFCQGQSESKLISPVDSSLEESRMRELYFLDSKDTPSTSLSQNKHKFVDTSSNSLITDLRFSQLKNSTSYNFSNNDIRMSEVPLPHTDDDVELRNSPSPYCNSFEETQLNPSTLQMYGNQGQLRFKNLQASHLCTEEAVGGKNVPSYFVSLGQDVIRNGSNNDINSNDSLHNISLNRDQLKMIVASSFGQGSVLIKNSQAAFNGQELYQHSKLPNSCYTSDHEHSNIKKVNPHSSNQLELALKSDAPILEKALHGLQEEALSSKKINSSDPSLRSIIQDLSTVKPSLTSNCKNSELENLAKSIASCPLVPHLKRIDSNNMKTIFNEENRIRNFSYPIYDDNQKLSLSEGKQGKMNAFHIGENGVSYHSKGEPSVYSSNLPSQSSESYNFASNSRLSHDGVTTSTKTSGSTVHMDHTQSKDLLESQPSVIAQVRASCKACDLCRITYLEKGFLNSNITCSVCLYHAKNDMKCVCNHPILKDELCSCREDKYGCSYCDKIFPSILLLQRHTFQHISDEDDLHSPESSEQLFSCSVCSQTFSDMTGLEQHVSTHKESYCNVCNRTFKHFNQNRHSCGAKYICNLCGAGFASNYNLKMHLLKHSGSLPYKCQECSKSFAKPSELSKHSLIHSGERPYSCDECSMTFTSPTYLRSHKSTHTGRKPHSCYVCNKSFTRPADVKRHMVIHTGARPYACEICGLAFADASNMRKHLTTHSKPHQGSDIKTYHCTYCGKMFARPSELKRHFFTHTNTRPYACHICGLAFTDSSNLKKHIQTHEKSSEHVCLQCDANFKTFKELEMHVSLSHGTRRFDANSEHNCQTCGATFSQLVDLQDHVLSHGAAPSFRCPVCSKNFCEQVFLVRHMLTHTEARPFICNECSKSFKSLSHLRSHLLIHTGEKTHICSKCNKSFLKKSSLLRHQGVHAREKVLALYQLA